jgi:hypothetical protein
MKKLLTTAFIALALVIGGAEFTPTAQAQGAGTAGASSGAVTAPAGDPTKSTPVTPAASQEQGLAWLLTQLMRLFAGLLGIAALTLNNAVYFTVVTMGDVVNKLAAIGVAWRILRDIGNIALLFGFIAVGLCVILRVDWYGGGEKLLPKLLIAAVALNFSLFAAMAVVDVGNLFATQFYIQINGGKPAAVLDPTSLENISNEGISNKLMASLGFTQIYGDALKNTSTLKFDGMIFISFMSILLFLITALVFFSLAFILVARFVILILLIIVSPIGVAGYAVPKLEGLAKQWWDMLIKQTLTAPVLLLGLYVALAVITDASFLTGFLANAEPSWTGFIQNGSLAGFAGLFLSYLVAMGLLLGVVVMSKKIGAYGADQAIKWGGRASFGATAFGLSMLPNAAGRLARAGIQNSRWRDSGTARFLTRYGARALENARFDVRSVPLVGAGLTLGGAGVAAAPVDRSSYNRGVQGRDWWRNSNQAARQRYDQELRMPNLKKAIADENYEDAEKYLKNLSDKELENRSVLRLLEDPTAAATLSQARFDKLMSGDTLNDAQKDNLRKLRTEGMIARYSDLTELEKLSGSAVSKLPDKVLAAPGVHSQLNVKQLSAVMKEDNIKDDTARTIGAHLRGSTSFQSYLTSLRATNAHQAKAIEDYWEL